jgi:hypothetical protein
MNPGYPVRVITHSGGGKVITTDYLPDWKTTPPTEPGWYWATDYANKNTGWKEIVRVEAEDGEFFVRTKDGAENNIESFEYWLGPLTVPDPPLE